MDRLGIAFQDITGAYVACAIHKMRPALNMTLLFDPKGSVEDFLEKTENRMGHMKIKHYLTVHPTKTEGRRDYFRVVNGEGYEGLMLDTGAQGMDTSLLNFAISDGLFQRSFVLDILDNYMERIPKKSFWRCPATVTGPMMFAAPSGRNILPSSIPYPFGWKGI